MRRTVTLMLIIYVSFHSAAYPVRDTVQKSGELLMMSCCPQLPDGEFTANCFGTAASKLRIM